MPPCAQAIATVIAAVNIARQNIGTLLNETYFRLEHDSG
jgi:hypothetical protein